MYILITCVFGFDSEVGNNQNLNLATELIIFFKNVTLKKKQVCVYLHLNSERRSTESKHCGAHNQTIQNGLNSTRREHKEFFNFLKIKNKDSC